MFNVNTEQFKGPFEKLLELIEERKLEITELNLASVTDDFLKYFESIKKSAQTIDQGHSDSPTGEEESLEQTDEQTTPRSEEEVRLLADFIVVAARLLLIKSKSLMPNLELTQEEETDIKDLEKRLQFYKDFKPAMTALKNMYASKNHSVSRPLFFGRPTIFYPSKNLDVNALNKAMSAIFETLKQLSLEFQTLESSLIKLEEKIEEIIIKVQEGIKNFGHLIKEKSKQEIVVMFLALLHLLREQTIEVEQTERFGEIGIRKAE